jgi:hypothetical protein
VVDHEDNEDDKAESMLTPEFMDGSHHGDVTNAGAMENSDALIAALETAYGVRDQSVAQHHNLLLCLSATFSLVIVYSRQAPV